MNAPPASVSVQIAARTPGVPRSASLRRWALAALGKQAEITLRVVGGREGRTLNRRYRGNDRATNVLSFSYEAGRMIRGDVVLCAPVISREAREQSKPVHSHYAHLTVHGVLHLRGFDHDTSSSARLMETRERRILRALGYPDPYL